MNTVIGCEPAGNETRSAPSRKRRKAAWLALGSALLAAWPAHALYKIVGPDGRVTYTDRAPTAAQGRSTTLSSSGLPLPEPVLPADLQQIVKRFPVVLYTSADCPPCEEARRLMRQRGIPHVEKTVLSEEDRAAWPHIVGGPETPAITIGNQSLRGLSLDAWNQYLDAAGYPRESKLPPNYTFAPAVPLVGPKPAEPARPAAAQGPTAGEAPRSDEPAATTPPGFKF